MKKLFLLAVLAMVSATLVGCAGVRETKLSNGMTLVQYKDKDAIGPNHTGAVLLPAVSTPTTESEPIILKSEKVVLEKTYTRSSTSWDNCKDATPNKNAKNVKRAEESETWTEEVLIQPQVAQERKEQPIPLGFGTGPGPLETILPAAALAAGYVGGQAVHRPDTNRTNVTQTGGGGGGASVGDVKAEAASASSAASSAEAWQQQKQKEALTSEIGVDIDN